MAKSFLPVIEIELLRHRKTESDSETFAFCRDIHKIAISKNSLSNYVVD